MAIRARFDLFTAGLCASRDGFTGANASSHWIRLALDRIIRWLAHTLGIFVLQIKNCGPNEDRTHDLRIANAALSQLSYRPVALNLASRILRVKFAWHAAWHEQQKARQ